MKSFGVAIVTYNGVDRVAQLLESMKTEREFIDYVLISEDPHPNPLVHTGYRAVAHEYRCVLETGEAWGCMQGNARQAMNAMPTDIVCLLSDDILVTPGCLRSVRENFTQYQDAPIGAAQIPYWPGCQDLINLGLIKAKDWWEAYPLFYATWRQWIKQVPRNKYWDYDGYPRIYVNVHGSGFAISREIWERVGGCSLETWCYDEDIAARIWTQTDSIIVAFPGPPFVHFGGASQCGNEHPNTDFHTLEAWQRAWGKSKEEVHTLIRQRMAERARWDDEFRRAA